MGRIRKTARHRIHERHCTRDLFFTRRRRLIEPTRELLLMLRREMIARVTLIGDFSPFSHKSSRGSDRVIVGGRETNEIALRAIRSSYASRVFVFLETNYQRV